MDIGTTGFDPVRDDIIRIEALKVTPGSRIRRKYATLVKPRRPLDKMVTSSTGITQSQLHRGGTSLKQAIEEFFKFVSGRRLVMFNADFCLPFLEAACARLGIAMPKKVVCSLKMAKKAWPGLERYSGVGHLMASVPAIKRRARRARSVCAREVAVYEAAAAKLRASA